MTLPSLSVRQHLDFLQLLGYRAPRAAFPRCAENVRRGSTQRFRQRSKAIQFKSLPSLRRVSFELWMSCTTKVFGSSSLMARRLQESIMGSDCPGLRLSIAQQISWFPWHLCPSRDSSRPSYEWSGYHVTCGGNTLWWSMAATYLCAGRKLTAPRKAFFPSRLCRQARKVQLSCPWSPMLLRRDFKGSLLQMSWQTHLFEVYRSVPLLAVVPRRAMVLLVRRAMKELLAVVPH